MQPIETPYLIETFLEIEKVAAIVEKIEKLGDISKHSLPGGFEANGTYHRVKVTVSWSIENFETNIPAKISQVLPIH